MLHMAVYKAAGVWNWDDGIVMMELGGGQARRSGILLPFQDACICNYCCLSSCVFILVLVFVTIMCVLLLSVIMCVS